MKAMFTERLKRLYIRYQECHDIDVNNVGRFYIILYLSYYYILRLPKLCNIRKTRSDPEYVQK